MVATLLGVSVSRSIIAGLEPFGARRVHVLPVGFQQASRCRARWRAAMPSSAASLARRLRTGHLARSPPRFAADAVHVGLNVHVRSSQR